MNWIAFIVLALAVSSYTIQKNILLLERYRPIRRKPTKHFGRFQLVESDDKSLDKYLQVLGFRKQIRDTILKMNVTFEFTSDIILGNNWEADDYNLTAKDTDSGKEHREVIKLEEWVETEYFGSSKIRVRVLWTQDYDIITEELEMGDVKSEITFNFTTEGCVVTFSCNDVTAVRKFERVACRQDVSFTIVPQLV